MNDVIKAMKGANVFAIDGKDMIVMDISKRLNPKLFEQGCHLVYTKMTKDEWVMLYHKMDYKPYWVEEKE
jgi:hypothetical protein